MDRMLRAVRSWLCHDRAASVATVAVFCLGVAVTQSASADAPVLTLLVDSGMFGKQVQLTPNSVSSSGTGTYYGSVIGPSDVWSLDYNLLANGGPTTAWNQGSFTFRNLAETVLDFHITLVMPLSSTGAMNGFYNGSLGGALIANANGGQFTSLAGLPLYQSSANGNSVAALFNSPLSITRLTAGSSSIGYQSFGGTSPTLPGPEFMTNISYQLHFSLTGGDTVVFTAALGGLGTPVPAPGAFALLGVAAVTGLGRRRRATKTIPRRT